MIKALFQEEFPHKDIKNTLSFVTPLWKALSAPITNTTGGGQSYNASHSYLIL